MNNQALATCIETAVQALGLELWGYEFHPYASGAVLRIYIDKVGGVLVDDCALVSRTVGAQLDVEDLIPGRYQLEVSSPGIDRTLFYPEQYERCVGRDLKIKLSHAIEGRRQWSGQLQQVAATTLTLLVEGEAVILPSTAIEKAICLGFLRQS